MSNAKCLFKGADHERRRLRHAAAVTSLTAILTTSSLPSFSAADAMAILAIQYALGTGG